MDKLFYMGIIIIAGLIMAKVISYLKLPNVTGYLVGGLIIGPSILGLIPHDVVSSFSIISEAALGFIAYGIGSEFNYKNLKAVGKGVIIITVFEALGAVLAVDLAMIFIFRQSVEFSIVLGAIAAATAPAATMMVVRQYKAKGPLVNTLLPIVAMDDAVGIILFGVSMAIAKSITSGKGSLSIGRAILCPSLEIIIALLLGLAIGIVVSFIGYKASGEDQLLCIVIAVVFIASGIANYLNVSSLLVCMMVGATVANLAPNSTRILSITDRFTPPLFIAFFTIAGADLNLSILKDVGVIGFGYIIVRVIGKIIGASTGAVVAKSPDVVKKYLGITLIPQAGVAIGLSLIAQTVLPDCGDAIRTIILSATVIYELIGPVVTKIAIKKAGEIGVTQ